MSMTIDQARGILRDYVLMTEARMDEPRDVYLNSIDIRLMKIADKVLIGHVKRIDDDLDKALKSIEQYGDEDLFCPEPVYRTVQAVRFLLGG